MHIYVIGHGGWNWFHMPFVATFYNVLVVVQWLTGRKSCQQTQSPFSEGRFAQLRRAIYSGQVKPF